MGIWTLFLLKAFLGVDELDSYYYYYYDDYYYYYGEQLALGISGADGMYDIGLSADDISDGDMISLSVHF